MLLALHTNHLITAAGLLAAAAAGTALAEARPRSQRGTADDILATITAVLILATPVLVLLGIIQAYGRAHSEGDDQLSPALAPSGVRPGQQRGGDDVNRPD